MRKKTMTKMEKVSKDIINIKFDKKDTLKGCLEKFFAILRKYNIHQGTPQFNDKGEVVGRACNNYDYTMCQTLFFDRVSAFFEWQLNFEEIPKDIE